MCGPSDVQVVLITEVDSIAPLMNAMNIKAYLVVFEYEPYKS
jgi:hypothetical protein